MAFSTSLSADCLPFCDIGADLHPTAGKIKEELAFGAAERAFYDNTFLATMRALLTPRYEAVFGRNISWVFRVVVYPYEMIRIADFACNTFYFIYTNESQLSSNTIESKFFSTDERFVRHQKTTDFFKNEGKVFCYVNETIKTVVMVAVNLSSSFFHSLQKSIVSVMPWFFKPGERLSDLEYRLIKSLDNSTPDEYLATLEELAKPYKFEESAIKGAISGFLTNQNVGRIKQLNGLIGDCNRNIAQLSTKIKDEIAHLSDFKIELLGLETFVKQTPEVDTLDFYQYFLHNQHLKLLGHDPNVLTFAVFDRLTYFDPDSAAGLLRNFERTNLCVTNRSDTNVSADDMKRLLLAIFVTQEVWLNLATVFTLDPVTGPAPCNNREYNDLFKNLDYLPNPHLTKFQCMGANEPVVNDAMLRQDYVAVLEQCIASNKNIDLSDSVVRGEFATQLYFEKKYRCIALPDGRNVTPAEAVLWLKEKEEKNG